ncbi:hypothetical protein [Aeromonas caviae]|uniref:hypothetical protein n=1 Tax=Aeromonas caviae TaxID=648 RepID=UPI00214E804F|nr:hypothetical protein [Aeromonas caviae]MCR3931404.1 hypothetical protein [Aeromonas caviae]
MFAPSIAIESGGGYDLSGLSKRLEGNEAFSLALEIALKKTEPESIATDELTIELKKAFEQIDQTTSEVAEPELKIATEKLWKAILETETESYPYIEVSGGAIEVKDTKDQLIMPYQADIDALEQFKRTDVIEALVIDGEKESPLGEVVLKQSALNEVRLSKLSAKARFVSDGDLVFFRTKQDRASYEKRKAAFMYRTLSGKRINNTV